MFVTMHQLKHPGGTLEGLGSVIIIIMIGEYVWQCLSNHIPVEGFRPVIIMIVACVWQCLSNHIPVEGFRPVIIMIVACVW